MAKRVQIVVPGFTLQLGQNNTFDTCGWKQGFAPGGDPFYLCRVEPIKGTTVPVDLTFDESEIEQVLTATDASRTFILRKGGAPVEYNTSTNPITFTPVTTTGNADDFNTNQGCILFNFGGALHVFTIANNKIFRAGNAIGGALEEVSTNLPERLQELNLSTAVAQGGISYQNRIWLTFGNTVVWSSTETLAEWLPSTRVDVTDDISAVIDSNAGSQQFLEDGQILQIIEHADTLYIFTERNAYITQVQTVDIQFGFTPLEFDVQYLGGAISVRNGLYFFAKTGVYKIDSNAVLDLISAPIEAALTNLRSFNPGDVTISAAVVEDDIHWTVDGLYTVAFNLNFSTINVCTANNNVVFFGEFIVDATTIDELGDLYDTIDGLPSTTIDALSEVGLNYHPIYSAREANTPADQHPIVLGSFGYTDNNFIRFNVIKSGAGRSYNVLTITVPELDNPKVRVKESTDNVWTDVGDSIDERFCVYDTYIKLDIEVRHFYSKP